jgi:hypothetical protein
MNSQELIADLRALGKQDAKVFFNLLADRVYDARLSNGQRLRDATDFMMWLRELGEASAGDVTGRCFQSPNVPSEEEIRTWTGVTTGPRCRRLIDNPCPRCGHVHEGSAECGAHIGGGRTCRCEMEVPA